MLGSPLEWSFSINSDRNRLWKACLGFKIVAWKAVFLYGVFLLFISKVKLAKPTFMFISIRILILIGMSEFCIGGWIRGHHHILAGRLACLWESIVSLLVLAWKNAMVLGKSSPKFNVMKPRALEFKSDKPLEWMRLFPSSENI